MNKVLLTALLIFLTLFSWSQVTNEGSPESWKYDFDDLSAVMMPKFDLNKRLAEDQINDEEALPYRFGYEFETDFNLNNSGQWDTLPNGDRVWRIRFTSQNALTMNFLLEDFYLPKNSKIYLYNNDRTDLIGAYNAQQNNENELLSTWLVEGEDVWIEYYEPKKVRNQGSFSITKVVHGYRSQTEYKIEKGINDSGPCNQDVDCPIGDMDDVKDIVKKSVALMLVNNNSFCTGSMVNNTSQDGTPYFLTANHCFSNPAAWSFRFNWISPSPICSGYSNNQQNTNTLTISGSTLRARRYNSDFCLVEINNPIPSSWDVVWAGWDRSDNVPSRSFGVHHPSGDIMKVARDDDAPGKVTQSGPQGGEPVWRIYDWDLGVTEGGSSGSPLYNEDGEVIGQLWRGLAACSGLNDNNQYDEYGRFGVSWNAGGNASNQLSNWLDPNNTNQIEIGPYPSQEVFDVDASLAIENFDEVVCGNSVTPSLVLINFGEDNLTSTNIEYSLDGALPTQISWNGNLATGESEVIDLPTLNLTLNEGNFSATVSNPNNTVDQNITNSSSNIDYIIDDSEIYEVVTVELSLTLDEYPEETSWEFKNNAGDILYSGQAYSTQNAVINETFNIAANDCYEFVINDEFGDGICCGFGQGSYSLTTVDGEVIASGGNFENSESTRFKNFTNLSNTAFNLNNQVKLYPNPTSGLTNIANSSGNTIKYQVFNISGKLISEGKVNSTENQIDLTNVNSGIYLIKLSDEVNQVTSTQKIIVK